jgi:hypothetical protein
LSLAFSLRHWSFSLIFCRFHTIIIIAFHYCHFFSLFSSSLLSSVWFRWILVTGHYTFFQYCHFHIGLLRCHCLRPLIIFLFIELIIIYAFVIVFIDIIIITNIHYFIITILLFFITIYYYYYLLLILVFRFYAIIILLLLLLLYAIILLHY